MIRQLHLLAEKVWCWWLSEFLALLPPAYLRRFAGPRWTLLLKLGDAITEIAVMAGDRCMAREAIAYPDASEEQLSRMRGTLHAATKGKSVAVIGVIPDHQSLIRPLTLPLAAKAHLDEAMRYQIERTSPFRQDNTLYGVKLLASDRASDELRLKLTIVPKVFVAELKERAARLGFPIDRFAIEADGALEAIAFKSQSTTRAKSSLETKALVAASLVLIASLLLVPVLDKRQRADALEREVSLSKPKAEQVLKLQSERDKIVGLRAQVIGLKKAALPPITVLSKLSELLDDQSFLFELRMDGAIVTMSGLSSDASKLAQRLGTIEAFKSVKFSGPVLREPQTARDRFTLILELAASS